MSTLISKSVIIGAVFSFVMLTNCDSKSHSNHPHGEAGHASAVSSSNSSGASGMAGAGGHSDWDYCLNANYVKVN